MVQNQYTVKNNNVQYYTENSSIYKNVISFEQFKNIQVKFKNTQVFCMNTDEVGYIWINNREWGIQWTEI